MKNIILTFVVFGLCLSCGKKSKDDTDDQKPVPPPSTQIPRWETVDRKELKFNYYVTNADSPFQLADDGTVAAVALQPWLTLKGAEDEPMSYVMMFEPSASDVCKRYHENNVFSWKGVVFETQPSGQIALYDEVNTTASTGKQLSYIHFLILKSDDSSCVKLTFYDINLKGYNHKLSILDKSEMAKAILGIAGSVVLK